MASKAPRLPVFGNLSKHTAMMIRHDLKAAGIPYVDASGRVADFHALRHSYITALAMSRAPVKVIQSLARHSTPVLTLGTYAHVGLYDQTAALDALPGPAPATPEPEAARMAATGTGGRTHRKTFAPSLPHDGDGNGRIVSVMGGSADLNTTTINLSLMKPEPLENRGLDASGRVPSASDERRGWDSNPRLACTNYGFQDRPTDSATTNSVNGLRPKTPPLAAHGKRAAQTLPPDLAAVVDSWPKLPEAIKAGIVAMIRATRAGEGDAR